MIEKLRDCFDEMVVYKDLRKSNFFSALGLPSFLRDWLLKKFADDDGIHGVVGQLQEVAQDHGNGKMDQVGEDTPLGHILHGKYFFLYLG